MSRDTPERDAADPLQVALQLESDSRADTAIAAGSEPTVAEYADALAGLQLVQRAVARERESNRGNDDPQTATASLESRRLGRFEIVRELGRGGFGLVLLARDPALDRLVALKVPRPDALADADARRRFEREARLGSLLSHPNIVPIFESGSAGPIAYLVSGYCGGESLAQWFAGQGRAIAPQLAARIVVQLAQAVQYAHQRGVIHRDLKPSNILLDFPAKGSGDEESLADALRITDFGLARSLGSGGDGLTRAGAIVGTPAYMAPEQAAGGTAHVGAAADIYALGVILFELLTGCPPFQKESDLATLRAVESAAPPKPRRLRPGIPPDLEAIALKCLEKSPSQRYPTAFDLQVDLEQFLQNRPVRARHITQMELVWRWCRRNPALAIALAALLLVAVVATWQWQRAESNSARAREFLGQAADLRARAERNLARSEVAIDQMLNEVAVALNGVPRLEALRSRLLGQALQLQQALADDQSDDPRVRFRTAQAFRRIAEIRLSLGELGNALAATDSAIDQLDRVAAGEGNAIDPTQVERERGRIAGLRSDLFRQSDDPQSAQAAAQESLAAWRQAAHSSGRTPEDIGESVRALRRSGMAFESIRDFEAAAETYRQALAMFDGLPDGSYSADFELLRGHLLNSLGVLHSRQGEPELAEKFYRQSLQVITPIVEQRPDRIDLGYHLAITAINLGNRYSRLKQHAQALPFYQQASTILEGLVLSFPDHIGYRRMAIRAASGLGLSQFRSGDPDTAATTLTGALEMQQQLPNESQSTQEYLDERSILFTNLGNVYLEGKQQIDSAEESHRQALDLLERYVGLAGESADLLRRISATHGNLATVYFRQGNHAAALAESEQAFEKAARACTLDSSSAACRSNLSHQVQQRVQIMLRAGAVDDVLTQLQRYCNLAPDQAVRTAECAALLGRVLGPKNATASTTDPPQPPIELNIATEDRERLVVAARDYLFRAVQAGAINPDELASDPNWQQILGDQSVADFLKGN